MWLRLAGLSLLLVSLVLVSLVLVLILGHLGSGLLGPGSSLFHGIGRQGGPLGAGAALVGVCHLGVVAEVRRAAGLEERGGGIALLLCGSCCRERGGQQRAKADAHGATCAVDAPAKLGLRL